MAFCPVELGNVSGKAARHIRHHLGALKDAARKIETFNALSAIKLAEERQGVPTISTTLQ